MLKAAIWERSIPCRGKPRLFLFRLVQLPPESVFSPSALSSLTISRPTDDAIIGAQLISQQILIILRPRTITSNGTIEGNEDNFSHGEIVSLKATPSLNKEFSHGKQLDPMIIRLRWDNHRSLEV